MDLDLTTTHAAAPSSEHERVRAAGPVVWSDALNGWLISSYDDVKTVLSDANAFANEGTPVAESFAPEAMLVTDSPLHHKIRAVWARPTSLSAAARMDEPMQRIADALLIPAARRLEAGESLDLVPLFESFTSEVITVLMDIPRDHRGDFQRWNRMISDSALLALEKDAPDNAGQIAKREVYAFLEAEAANRRARLRAGDEPDDLVSLMVAAEGRNGITASIALDNLVNLFLGALDTTVRWLGNIVVTLARHPATREQVRTDRSLLPQAAEEVMRLETVIQLSQRIVRGDGVALRGQALRAGQNVYVLPGAANRDPAVFAEPNRFDIHRKGKLHMGFGFGIHQCLGMNIARQEAVVFIGRMFDLLPDLDIADCRYGPTWSLWGPQALVVKASSR